jgi:ParB family chromosome partitioning protein
LTLIKLKQQIVIDNNEYQLIAGERRLKACKSLQMTNIIVNTISVKDKEFSFSERMDWAKRLEVIEKEKEKENLRLAW